MDQKKLIARVISSSYKHFKYVENILDNVTYQSVILFKDSQVLCSPNNNYNGWGDYFYKKEKYKDCVMFELAKHIFSHRDGTVMWEDIAHNKDSIKLDSERKKHNIYNGITLLKKHNSLYTLALTACSSREVKTNQFYSNVIMSKDNIINNFIMYLS